MIKNLDFEIIRQIGAIEDKNDRLAAAALMYAHAGFYVVPIRPNGKAIPPKPRDPSEPQFTYDSATRNPNTVSVWWGEGGIFRGWNIGLACGAKDGIFVLDIDRHGDKDGFETLNSLCEEFSIDDLQAPCQLTPNGGKHYIFKWQDGCTSSSDKIGTGIDTRGGKGKNSSHIVVWPSVVDGKEYRWDSVGLLPPPPDFVLNSLGGSWDPSQTPIPGSGRGNENVNNEDLERRYSLNELVPVLKAINPNTLSYDEWLNVGMAIHSQHPDEKGLTLWDRWSKTGSRYEQGECAKRWNGFKPEGTVRIGTLIKYAMLRGYMPKPPVIEILKSNEETPLDKMVKEFNKEWALAVVGGKIRVIGTKLNDDPDQDLVLMSIEDFKTLTMNQKIVTTDAKGQPKVVYKSGVWLADENRKEYLRGIVFRPDWGTESTEAYNLWRGWKRVPRPGDWSKMKAHILEVVCSGDGEHYNWVLDWMAQLYQDPANPTGTALVLKGVEGAGKGIFIDAMGKTIGRHYKHLTQPEHIVGRFNGHMQDALLVFADEVVYGGDKRTSGILKALVTEEKLMLERKGVDTIGYRNCARLAMASNEDWIVPAGPHSRRWFVLEVSPHRTGDRDYFEAIKKEMDNGGIEAMMHELMGRQITNDLRVAPATRALQVQRASYVAYNSAIQWLADKIERGAMECSDLGRNDVEATPGWPTIVERIEMFDAYEQWARLRNYRVVTKAQFYAKMEELGFKQDRKQVGTDRKYVFIVPTLGEAALNMRNNGGVDVGL